MLLNHLYRNTAPVVFYAALFFFLVKLLGRVQLFATLWTVAYQAPLSMGFPRQEYWSGVSVPMKVK